jgi:hypothetical protein
MKISEETVKKLIRTITPGKFFMMEYRKKDGTHRKALCQLGVHNTANPDLTPKGVGETAQDALRAGRVKYYEPNHKNDDGTRSPAYRQAVISRIDKITVNHRTYIVKHKENEA